MADLNTLAQQVIESEFDYLTGTDRICQKTTIENWFRYNLGLLNTHLFTCYSGESPEWGLEEQAIYKAMYLSSFYGQEAKKVLRNMNSNTLEWLTLKEGDSQITLQNKNEVAKTYRGLASEMTEEVNRLVQNYRLYQVNPTDVSVSVSTFDGFE